jgi:hypothetical protein
VTLPRLRTGLRRDGSPDSVRLWCPVGLEEVEPCARAERDVEEPVGYVDSGRFQTDNDEHREYDADDVWRPQL